MFTSVYISGSIELRVKSTRVYRCVSGLTKGVGFIRFNLKSEAEAAIKLRSGTVPPGATEPITVKFANQPTISKVAPAPVQSVATVAAATGAAVNANLKCVSSVILRLLRQQLCSGCICDAMRSHRRATSALFAL